MQEEIEHKTVNLAISTTKLSARTLLRGMQFLLRQYDKHASQGKQSMKRLVRHGSAVPMWRSRKPASRALTVMPSGITSTTPSRKTCPARRPGI